MSTTNSIPTREEISKMTQHEKVMLFCQKFNVDTTENNYNKRLLLFKLLAEEMMELCHALSLYRDDVTEVFLTHLSPRRFMDEKEKVQKCSTEAAILDAICDMRYYEEQILKMADVHDIADEAMTEVTYSNLTKLGNDGKPIISDGSDGKPVGKILKSEDYKEPDIESIILKKYSRT